MMLAAQTERKMLLKMYESLYHPYHSPPFYPVFSLLIFLFFFDGLKCFFPFSLCVALISFTQPTIVSVYIPSVHFLRISLFWFAWFSLKHFFYINFLWEKFTRKFFNGFFGWIENFQTELNFLSFMVIRKKILGQDFSSCIKNH